MIKRINKNIFRSLIKNSVPIIFDIGCYDGADSEEFLGLFPGAEIYPFEIDPWAIILFEKKMSIPLNKIALSNIDGNIDWYSSDHHASSSTKKPKEHLNIYRDIHFQNKTTIPSTRLDTWMGGKDIKEIDIMWVDVNGAEREFIEGATQTLEKVKYLVMEFCEKELYEGALNLKTLQKLLPGFKSIGVYGFNGNFGNVLLKKI